MDEKQRRTVSRAAFVNRVHKLSNFELLNKLRVKFGRVEKELNQWECAFTEPPPQERLRDVR